MDFDTRKFMTNRTDFSQWLIDFAEDRMVACQKIGEKRASRHGDKSWQWRMTIVQEIFWSKVGYFSLVKL